MPPEMSTKSSSKNKPPVAASQVNLQKLKGNIFEDAMILKMLQERNYENIELHKTLKLAKENLNKMMVEYSKLKRERDEMFAQASVLQNQYFTLLETSANAMASLNLKVEEVKALNVKITSLENIKTTLESKVKENQISQAKNSFQVREINRLNKELGEKDQRIKSLEAALLNKGSMSKESHLELQNNYYKLDKNYIQVGKYQEEVTILDNALLNPTQILNDKEAILPLDSPLFPLIKKLKILILSVIGTPSIAGNNSTATNTIPQPNVGFPYKVKPKTRKQKSYLIKNLILNIDINKNIVINCFQQLIEAGLINSDQEVGESISNLITKVKEISENLELINKTKNYLESLAIAHQEQISSMKAELLVKDTNNNNNSNNSNNSNNTSTTSNDKDVQSIMSSNESTLIEREPMKTKRMRSEELICSSELQTPMNEMNVVGSPRGFTQSNSEFDSASTTSSSLQIFNFIEPNLFEEELFQDPILFKKNSLEFDKNFTSDCLWNGKFEKKFNQQISNSPKMYISDEASISHALNLISDGKKVMNSQLFSHFTDLNSTNLLTFFNSLLTIIRSFSIQSPILDSTLPSTCSDLETIIIDESYRRNIPTQLLLWERKISIYLLTMSIKFPKLPILPQLFQLTNNLIVIGCQTKEDRGYTISLTRIFSALSLATQDMFSIRCLIYDLLFFSIKGKNLLSILANIAHLYSDAFTHASNSSDHVYLQTIRAVTASLHAKISTDENSSKANLCYRILMEKAHFPGPNLALPLNAIYSSLLAQLGSEFTDEQNHPMLLRCISLVANTAGFDQPSLTGSPTTSNTTTKKVQQVLTN